MTAVPRSHRAQSVRRMQDRAAQDFIRPFQSRVAVWHQTAAHLEAIANAGRGTAEHLATARATLAAIREGQASLAARLGDSADAALSASSYAHDLKQSLARAEGRTARVVAGLASRADIA